MPGRFVTRDGRVVDLDHWRPGEGLHEFFVSAGSIELIMRDAGVPQPPEIPGWPPAADADD
ncbi:hypothetical protein [Frankia sp. AgKG'84/4]|uniref:hypothetical protein n=1 Tax=Frankia sp. AgKG'84/4 TaxID=573490 RepID=UPI00200CDDD4|nr:hypothetical protein [Frankia sp. AgKG'84/4]MCL9797358.1 hypothetical protein [Frankia sp. AgKG'84/4]